MVRGSHPFLGCLWPFGSINIIDNYLNSIPLFSIVHIRFSPLQEFVVQYVPLQGFVVNLQGHFALILLSSSGELRLLT